MRVDIEDELKNEEAKKAPKSKSTKDTKEKTSDKTSEKKKADTKKTTKKDTKSTSSDTEKKTTTNNKKKSTTTTAKNTKNAKTIKVDILDEEPTADKKAEKMKLPVVRKVHIRIGYLIIACLLVVVGGFFTKVAIWEHNYLAAKEGSERATVETEENTGGIYETGDGEEIDETVPDEATIQAYTVDPNKPRFLSIPAIGVRNSRVREINVINNGELGTPSNINDTGWYVGSALPGERGTSVMDGHGGSLGYGIFRNLPKIKAGDKVTIEMGDGRFFTYRVVDVTTRNIGDEANDYMSTAFSSPEGNAPSLTLITCTGDWSQRQKTYSQRLFVRAVLE